MVGLGEKLLWGDRAMRIDPSKFPQTARYHDRHLKADVSVTIDENGAIIRRNPYSSLPTAVTVPAKAFIGITARATHDETGKITVTLELMHVDPQLSVPLLVAHDLNNVVEDWRSWSKIYKLPMMLVEEDGVARVINRQAASVKMPKQRLPIELSAELKKNFKLRIFYRNKLSALRLIVWGIAVVSR